MWSTAEACHSENSWRRDRNAQPVRVAPDKLLSFICTSYLPNLLYIVGVKSHYICT